MPSLVPSTPLDTKVVGPLGIKLSKSEDLWDSGVPDFKVGVLLYPELRFSWQGDEYVLFPQEAEKLPGLFVVESLYPKLEYLLTLWGKREIPDSADPNLIRRGPLEMFAFLVSETQGDKIVGMSNRGNEWQTFRQVELRDYEVVDG